MEIADLPEGIKDEEEERLKESGSQEASRKVSKLSTPRQMACVEEAEDEESPATMAHRKKPI